MLSKQCCRVFFNGIFNENSQCMVNPTSISFTRSNLMHQSASDSFSFHFNHGLRIQAVRSYFLRFNSREGVSNPFKNTAVGLRTHPEHQAHICASYGQILHSHFTGCPKSLHTCGTMDARTTSVASSSADVRGRPLLLGRSASPPVFSSLLVSLVTVLCVCM